MKDKQLLDKPKHDRLISTVSQTLTTAVHTKLDKLIKAEMRASAVPGEGRTLSVCPISCCQCAGYSIHNHNCVSCCCLLVIAAIMESISSVREELSGCVGRCVTDTNVAIRDGVAHLVKSKVRINSE